MAIDLVPGCMWICGAINVGSRATLVLLIASFAHGQGYVGSKVCEKCHADIAKSYAQTAMANASGRLSDLHLPEGRVVAAKAGVTYTVTGTQLSYRKGSIEGSKLLSYYIGSGTHGRGFIFEEQGQPFQSPVAYYGPQRGWDLAPGYEDETSVFLGRKVEQACLACHTSGGLQGEGAISCERCHGPGEAHVNKTGPIVNPAKLDAERRDSVCAQCHLTGETRVLKPGRSETTYRPGDLLSDHVVPFVWASPDKAQFKVVGHFEGLWQSKCKRMSGDRLSCLTCHDPHVQVAESEKASSYRAKCLSCHDQATCTAPAAARKAKADSCIACHMQQRPSTDGQHTAFTDHAIRRTPLAEQKAGHSQELVAFWQARATERDYALADADTGNWPKAREELLKVSSDPTVAAQLAYTYDYAGEPDKAETLYETALTTDPENLLALTNLGTHLARRGEIPRAVELWKKALAINPGLLAPGLNLARGEWRLGRRSEAIETVKRVLSLNPDSDAALGLFEDMQKQR